VGPGPPDALKVGRRSLIRVAQVIPELPTFAVDDGFAYRIPDTLGEVSVGSMVRVPLGGRRVRGYVVDVRDVAPTGRPLKDLIAVSGDYSVFDERLLQTLRWSAVYYVAPLGAVLGRAAPPNLPRRRTSEGFPPVDPIAAPLPAVATALEQGARIRPQYLIGTGPWTDAAAGLIAPAAAANRSSLVILPTVAEAHAMAEALIASYGNRVAYATSSLPHRTITRSWVTARTRPGTIVIGTREVALWPVAALGLGVVVEEGRRAMKAPASPTLHVREVLRRRSTVERFSLVFSGPVPTTEMIAAGTETHEPGGRAWPLVEIIDRSEDPPGSNLVGERVRRALQGLTGRDGTGFVLVHRRGYAPAFRCVQCREIRRCRQCGAAADRGNTCRRCEALLGSCAECGGERFEPLGAGVGRIVDELARSIGDAVGPPGSGRPVVVGTERDLPEQAPVDLAIAVDADALLLAPNYRAEEEALRLLARLAGLVRRGSGNRCMVQTSQPTHPAIAALRHGHPSEFLAAVIAVRQQQQFPPMGQLIAIDVRDAPAELDRELLQAAGEAEVLGPAATPHGERWLVQGSDLRPMKIRLRPLVQAWRDAGARVRVDADPIDL
jgi:primosomal protein N' (replication factor Y)